MSLIFLMGDVFITMGAMIDLRGEGYGKRGGYSEGSKRLEENRIPEDIYQECVGLRIHSSNRLGWFTYRYPHWMGHNSYQHWISPNKPLCHRHTLATILETLHANPSCSYP